MDQPQYKSQAARDAQRLGYGDTHYWEYLDESAAEKYAKGYTDSFTRTLSEALRGNDGI